MELAGLRHEVAFVKEQFSVSERQACKLFAVDRSTYRYEPRPDRNAQLRGEMMALAARSRVMATGDCMPFSVAVVGL